MTVCGKQVTPQPLHIGVVLDRSRWWDVSSGAQVCRLDGHTDYVRAAGVSPANMETWATGGYDHSVRLWDMRMRNSCVMTLDHGSPVEDLEFFPSGARVDGSGCWERSHAGFFEWAGFDIP